MKNNKTCLMHKGWNEQFLKTFCKLTFASLLTESSEC